MRNPFKHSGPRNKKDSQGQAVFEFIFFLPVVVLVFYILVSLSNSLNGSINQQKQARGYFYAKVKNNSLIPKHSDLSDDRFRKFGMFFIGWKEEFVDGNFPKLACYPFRIPFLTPPEEDCDSYDADEVGFIRVATVYGICGATVEKANLSDEVYQNSILVSGLEGSVSQASSCFIQR